jgi:Mpv17 / PMP22 family
MIASLLSALRQRPLLFNTMTGGILCAGSDAVAQQLEQQQQQQQQKDDNGHQHPEKQQNVPPRIVVATMSSLPACFEYDYHRVGCAGLIGMFFGGIVYPQAYALLDATWIGTSLTMLLKKSIFEIATVGIFVNSMSMTSRGLLQQQKQQQQQEQQQQQSPDINDSTLKKQQSQPQQLNQHRTVQDVLEHVANELPTVTRNDILVWLPYNMIAFSMVPPMLRPTTTAMMEASWQTYISVRSHDYTTAATTSTAASGTATPETSDTTATTTMIESATATAIP